jgi:two-component system phosphate regulon sensor histidine kinase PhoR
MGVWQKEIVIALLLFLVVLIVGGITGSFTSLALLLTLGLLLRQLFQIHRFEKWIRIGGGGKYPKTSGVWEEIYYHVYRMIKNAKRNWAKWLINFASPQKRYLTPPLF